MTAPVGRREFFALEAGEYLERLALLIGSTDALSADDLVRHARALRGAALMAGPPGFASASGAIEATVKSLRDGTVEWTPVLAERLAQAVEDCKALLRKVREWTDTDAQRCERIAEQLEADPAPRRPPGGGGAPGLTSGVRAYVAREAASVAAALDQMADAADLRPAPEVAGPLLHRLQPLRGLGALPGLSPLPDLLETLDLALTTTGKGGAWSPLTGKAFRVVGSALARMARDIAELGIPQHDSTEVVQATELLREAFLLEEDVVPVASLVDPRDDGGIVSRGSPPPARPVAGESAIELVSLGDRLRQSADQTRSHLPRSARALQLLGLVIALRGLSLTRAVREGTRELFRRLDREIMAGRALTHGDDFTAILRDAADRLAEAADAGGATALPEALAPLIAALDALAGATPTADLAVVPIEALAPDPAVDSDVVPIEALLYRPPAEPPVGMLPFEQTFSTYYRLLNEEGDTALGPVVPIESLAPDPETELVPIQSLLYRGRRALERADLVRRELDAALRGSADLTAAQPLIAELLDLVPLALADER
jgi:hypothetical protein